MKGLWYFKDIGTETLKAEPIYTDKFTYYIQVYVNGRIKIMIYNVNTDKYSFIVGDKKTQHNSAYLLHQIVSVVEHNKDDNKAIREVINKYWAPIKEKSVALRKQKNYERGAASAFRED